MANTAKSTRPSDEQVDEIVQESMVSYTLDLDSPDEADENDFSTPIPDGMYAATVSGVELRYGQDSGEPYLNVEFTLSGEQFHGRRQWGIISFSPKARSIAKKSLRALLGQGAGVFNPMNEEDQDRLGDRQCVLKVGHKVHNDKPRNEVKAILPFNTASRPAAGSGSKLF